MLHDPFQGRSTRVIVRGPYSCNLLTGLGRQQIILVQLPRKSAGPLEYRTHRLLCSLDQLQQVPDTSDTAPLLEHQFVMLPSSPTVAVSADRASK